MGFERASIKQTKLRLALFGPSGSGKTFTALQLAKGIGGRIAVIDSEAGRAAKYSDRFEFDTVQLESYNIETYAYWLEKAKEYDVVIVDSLSHAWEALKDEVNKIGQTKYRGNSWAAWSEGTPKQQRFIDLLIRYPTHIIVTMRVLTEWTVEQRDGRNTPIRVGLNPQQGKGIEYEFDVLMEMTPEHTARIIKDNSGKFQDQIIEKPGIEFGASLSAWINGLEVEKEDAAKVLGGQSQLQQPKTTNIDTKETALDRAKANIKALVGARYADENQQIAILRGIKTFMDNNGVDFIAIFDAFKKDPNDFLTMIEKSISI